MFERETEIVRESSQVGLVKEFLEVLFNTFIHIRSQNYFECDCGRDGSEDGNHPDNNDNHFCSLFRDSEVQGMNDNKISVCCDGGQSEDGHVD